MPIIARHWRGEALSRVSAMPFAEARASQPDTGFCRGLAGHRTRARGVQGCLQHASKNER